MTGDGAVENGSTDEPMMESGSVPDVKLTGNAPGKKLEFGLVGSGKRTTVPSVFHEEEDDDSQKEKKMRPLVPIDYSTEELQAVQTNDGEAPPISVASDDTGKRIISKDVKSDAERNRNRRQHDRPSHRERDHERGDDEAPRAREILDAKKLIDMIPKTKDDLFSYEVNWAVYDEVTIIICVKLFMIVCYQGSIGNNLFVSVVTNKDKFAYIRFPLTL